MFSRIKSRVLGLAVITLLLVPTLVQASEILDKSRLEQGVISINDKGAKFISPKPLKVMISKDGEKYSYDVNENNNFPLQGGDGEYRIDVLEKVSGKMYKVLSREEVQVVMPDKHAVYLQSIQLIHWDESMEPVKRAAELTAKAKSDQEKLTAIYKDVVNRVSYDYEKARTVKSAYIPSIEESYASRQGICYDYASLTAAMLRSVGIPAKLVMGYKADLQEYHAWNEVYLEESGQWVTIDTTYDAMQARNKVPGVMVKEEREYQPQKRY